jgi:hypothetical protein
MTTLEKSSIVDPFGGGNFGFDLFTNAVDHTASTEISNTVSNVINSSITQNVDNDLNLSIINVVTTTINKSLGIESVDEVLPTLEIGDNLIDSIVNSVVIQINESLVTTNTEGNLNKSIIDLVTKTINSQLSTITGSEEFNGDLITSIVSSVTTTINNSIANNEDSTINQSIVNVVTDTINNALGDIVEEDDLDLIDSITNAVSTKIVYNINNNIDSEINQGISSVAQSTINNAIDDVTVEIFEDTIRIKDDGVSNLKLLNSSIDLISSDGILVTNSHVNLGETIEINLDDTVIRTFGNQTKDTGTIRLLDDTNSASSSSGCMILDGGLGIKKDVHCDGDISGLNFNATSDKRLKTNIKDLKNSLHIIEKIDCCSYKWKKSKVKNCNNKLTYGVIAQQLEEIGLEHVVNNDGEYKSVNYLQLIPLLINSVKELNCEVNKLKTIIKTK